MLAARWSPSTSKLLVSHAVLWVWKAVYFSGRLADSLFVRNYLGIKVYYRAVKPRFVLFLLQKVQSFFKILLFFEIIICPEDNSYRYF